MENLSEVLSSFDDIEITCSVHKLPAIGICAEYYCSSSRFYCMKCIKEGITCITKENHELISLSELLYRFFIKPENKTIDLQELNSLVEVIKDFDQKEMDMSLAQFLSNSSKTIEKIQSDLNSTVDLCLQKIMLENKTKIKDFRELLKLNAKEKDDVNRLLQVKIPSLLAMNTGISQENINDFICSSLKTKEDKNKLINDIKYLSKTDKTLQTIEKIDNMMHVDKLTRETKEKELSNKLDTIFGELEESFDKKLQELEQLIIPKKESSMLYPSKNINQKFKNNPKEISFRKNICETAHKTNSIDSVFSVFKSIKGDSLVIWGTPQYNIECYDLLQEKIIKTVHSAHSNTIFSCRHYLDRKGKRDLAITSSYDRSVKVWNIKDNWENIVTIPTAHTGYYIYSVSILCDEKALQNYIITTAPNEYSKVWDFTGKHLRIFGVSNESTYFIDVYYAVKDAKYYILNANSQDVKVYDFKTGQIFKNYKGTPQTWHMSATVIDINKVPTLIESDGNGNLRVWGFHSGELIKTISSGGIINLRGLCVWNEQYVFSTGSDYQVKLYDITNGVYVKGFPGHKSTACSVEKIVHPLYGECLISHGLDGNLKLWTLPQNS